MRVTRSTTLRFAALIFFLQLIGGAGVLLTVRQLTRAEITGDAQTYAERLRDDLLGAWRQGGQAGLAAMADARSDPDRLPRSAILVIDPQGRFVAGNLAAWPPTLDPEDGATTIDLFRIGGEESERMRVIATHLPDGGRLLTGHVIEGELHVASVMEGAMLAALALGVILAGLAAWAAAQMIERRLNATVATAEAIAAGDLDKRVPLHDADDAFEALAHSVNHMLDRITMLMGELKIATDGLAHDLRSPLTRLRAMLEKALTASQDPEAREMVARSIEEGDRLLAMLDTALRITRAEAGLGREAFHRTDVSALLVDMAEVYGPLAEERGFTIEADAPDGLTAPVHRELLGQAIANLIDNALKYGRGRIHLAARAEGEMLAITVADDGPGIPVDRRGEALRRFGRLDAARSESGAGLGLSLAAAAARLHGGTLELGDNNPGLVVRLTIGR